MTDRERFLAEGRPRWKALEALLGELRLVDAAQWWSLSRAYRAVCADLARARSLDLPPDVQTYLDDLAARAHNRLYGRRRRGRFDLLDTVLRQGPVELRRRAWAFWAAFALFYGPFLVGALGAYASDGFATQVMSPDQLAAMESAYSRPTDGRGLGGDSMMAGFYVFNNVGIAFRCFATGLLGGLGSVFFLVYNGLVIGTVFGHLFGVGHGHNLLMFTSGHSAWELTGIVVSGAAGLTMGWALLAPGTRSRLGSLRAVGPALFRLVSVAGLLLLVAAGIEGFWSSLPLSRAVKYGFGLVQWGIVTAWLVGAGRAGGEG